MEVENCPIKKKKTHEYCSENAEVSGGNFLISHEEDKTERGGENEKMKRKIEKKGKWRSQKVRMGR